MKSTIKTVVFWSVIVVSAFLMWQVVKNGSNQQQTPEISYSEFLSQVEAGNVARVTISQNEVYGAYGDRSSFRVIGPAGQEGMLQLLRQKNVEIWFRNTSGGSWPAQLLGSWAPLILLAALWFFMIRQMQQRRPQTRTDSSTGPVDTRWQGK